MIANRLAGGTIGSTGGSFVLAEWVDKGETSRDRPIAPPHLHRSEDEAWYVLEGRLGFRVGDDEVEVGPGGGVVAPAGTAHTYWNASTSRARYLLVMGPVTFRLIEAIHALDAVRSGATAGPFPRARLRAASLGRSGTGAGDLR